MKSEQTNKKSEQDDNQSVMQQHIAEYLMKVHIKIVGTFKNST